MQNESSVVIGSDAVLYAIFICQKGLIKTHLNFNSKLSNRGCVPGLCRLVEVKVLYGVKNVPQDPLRYSITKVVIAPAVGMLSENHEARIR
jgi:hypothetical protein